MGSAISQAARNASYVARKTGESIRCASRQVGQMIVDASSSIWSGIKATPGFVWYCFDESFEFMSREWAMKVPSMTFARDILDIPQGDMEWYDKIGAAIYGALGYTTRPFKAINDKKFASLDMQSSFSFQSTGNASGSTQRIKGCQKMIIYICSHPEKIKENVLAHKEIDIDGNDFLVPTNVWYTFDVSDLDFADSRSMNEVYFHIHVSSIQSYTGVVLATDKNFKEMNFSLKKKADEFYAENYGNEFEEEETMADMLIE